MGTSDCQGKEGSGLMIIVTGEARFGAGEIARLRDALAANVASSRAEEGCERYAYGIDLADPDVLLISEAWRDQAALDAHGKRIAELMAPLADADIKSISVKAYEAHFLQKVLGD
jgi:quinol monooxygenase YgiN